MIARIVRIARIIVEILGWIVVFVSGVGGLVFATALLFGFWGYLVVSGGRTAQALLTNIILGSIFAMAMSLPAWLGPFALASGLGKKRDSLLMIFLGVGTYVWVITHLTGTPSELLQWLLFPGWSLMVLAGLVFGTYVRLRPKAAKTI